MSVSKDLANCWTDIVLLFHCKTKIKFFFLGGGDLGDYPLVSYEAATPNKKQTKC